MNCQFIVFNKDFNKQRYFTDFLSIATQVYFVSEGKADQLLARRRRDVPMSSFSSEVLTKDACASDGTCKHKFEGFKPFQKYRLAMRAFNSGGNGPPSDEIRFQTKEDGMKNKPRALQ